MYGRSMRIVMPLGLLAAIFALGCGGAGGTKNKNRNRQESGQTRSRASAAQTADEYMSQAGLALSEGDEAGALEYYLYAARAYDDAGEVVIERAEAHFLAAGLAYQLGEKTQAIEEYDAAVDIYLRFSGNSKIKGANALNNMGTIYKEMEQKSKARNCWERALQIYKSAPKELQSQSNMAKIEQNLSDLAEGF